MQAFCTPRKKKRSSVAKLVGRLQGAEPRLQSQPANADTNPNASGLRQTQSAIQHTRHLIYALLWSLYL